MSLVKFQNFSGIKNEQHTPRAIAQADLKNGYAVVIKYEDGVEKAAVPASETEAKGDIYFVQNVITTPELDNYDDFVVKKGKPVRAFNYAHSANEIVEISGDLVTGSPAIGDTLVADTDGTYKKETATTGYKVVLKVVDFNTIGGKGYDCLIVAE